MVVATRADVTQAKSDLWSSALSFVFAVVLSLAAAHPFQWLWNNVLIGVVDFFNPVAVGGNTWENYWAAFCVVLVIATMLRFASAITKVEGKFDFQGMANSLWPAANAALPVLYAFVTVWGVRELFL